VNILLIKFRNIGDVLLSTPLISNLKKIIKKHSIDIVNIHSGKDTWVGGLAAKLAGAKFMSRKVVEIYNHLLS
jgi:hypothetical protein